MSQLFSQAWEALAAHFGAERMNKIISSRRQFGAHLLPDIQTSALDQLAAYETVLLGVHQTLDLTPLTISGLLVRSGNSTIAITPLQYQDVDTGEPEPFTALNNGLWLFHVEAHPVTVLLSQYMDRFTQTRYVQVEIAALPGPSCSRFTRSFFAAIQNSAESSTLYRGKILSFEAGSDFSGMRADMHVHKMVPVDREQVILDGPTMARIDRHIFEFDRHREALRSLGQSTRKGVLLYGPPGTGKTHVIRYVASNLSDRTTVLITAEQVGQLSRYMLLARTLQPSIVVLEDVDLVGRSREGMNSPKTEILLNRLLNEMDGLGEDADIVFILTTNRPDEIEEALASRPGRVDEAIEIANPDAACRARLVALYGQSLTVSAEAVAEIVARSEAASAAFIKEIVRRLAQEALTTEKANQIDVETVDAVLGEAALGRSRMGRRIVGLPGSAACRQGRKAQPLDGCGEDL